MALSIWGKQALVGVCVGRKSLTRYVFDPDSRPSFDALMAALVTQGISLDWSYLQDLWTMACASILPYQSKMWGCGIYFISRVWGGGCCLVCYFSLLGLLLFFPPTFFYLPVSFIHSHSFIISSPLSSDTPLRGCAVKILSSLESFAWG